LQAALKGDHGSVVRFPLDVPEHPALWFSIVFGGVNGLLIIAGVVALWRARPSARKSFLSVRQVAEALREGTMSLGQAKSALTGAHWTRRPALSLLDDVDGGAQPEDDNDGWHLAALVPGGVISAYELELLARAMKPPAAAGAHS